LRQLIKLRDNLTVGDVSVATTSGSSLTPEKDWDQNFLS